MKHFFTISIFFIIFTWVFNYTSHATDTSRIEDYDTVAVKQPSYFGYVYPNPANDNITIGVKNLNIANSDVHVYSLLGEPVNCKAIQFFREEIQMDISNLDTGIYFLKITNNHRSETVKVFVN